MDRFLEGKYALVTGGTRGIGRAIAAALLRRGASVAVCGTQQETLVKALEHLGTEAPAGTRVIGQVANVGDYEQVERLFTWIDAEFRALDVLVNNAGIGMFAKVADLTPEVWRWTMDTNLTGAFYCSHLALPRLRKRGGGFIIQISSLAGKNPFAGGAAYNASKFGLNGFSEALMLDHRYDGVRVCAILPGSVDTDFGAGGKASAWKIAPEDIAEIVLTVLRMSARTLISRVEVRPSQPIK